jgi:hypothetical protein
MKAPERFLPYVLILGLGWALFVFGLGSVVDRALDGKWPHVSAAHWAFRIIASVLFGAVMWALHQSRKSREL